MLQDDIAALLHKAIRKAQRDKALAKFDIPKIDVERPKEGSHGDFATPICMQLPRLARMAPLAIAEIVVRRLPKADYLGKIEIAKPGYINLYLSESWLAQRVDAILAAGERFGSVDLGKQRKVQVEFISANPTGPLHVGSARNAVLGDVLANVLAAAGYDVQREYYVNDAGTQMGIFAETLYARYAQALGHDEAVPEAGYQGPYMIEFGKRAAQEHGTHFLEMERAQALKALGDIGLGYVLESVRADTELMGIHFDRWFSERSLYDEGVFAQVMTILRQGNHLVERDGAVWFNATGLSADREASPERSTGDKDEVIIRSSGAPGYFASDIAYHYDKFIRRGFEWVIDVWGADHQGHVPRMHAMMRALGLDPKALTLILYQLVTLKRGGEIVRLSKRTGEMISLREVLEDVGSDAVRFFLVSRAAESQMEFDLDLAKQQSNENPVYYVQYAHARIHSILEVAKERGLETEEGDVSLLKHPMELELIRRMLMLPEVVESSAVTLSPHHLAHYAQDLASQFHLFYRDCHVVSSEPEERELSLARLKLVRAAKAVLARSLHLMGMSAPEHM
jgi:arginyl-tRNA synthetase